MGTTKHLGKLCGFRFGSSLDEPWREPCRALYLNYEFQFPGL